MKRTDKDRIVIFDTTLRDGEQSPGASLTHREKLELAHLLALLNVDVIEAGFPIASPDDFAAVHAIAESIQGPTIAALARTMDKDIERAGNAIAPAAKRRIHTFSSGSDIHLKNMLKMTRAQNIERSVKAVKFARTFTEDVEYSAQDTTRADRDYLVELYTAVAEAGATTLNIPDTVGYAIPDEYADLIAYITGRIRVPGIVFSVHCHNDLGLAVANSLAAIKAGARQIECSINGLGERAGNTSLEEIVMAIRTRRDALNAFTNVNTREIYRTSRMVSRLTGIAVQRNKAIVGANAFAHESGVHQDGMLKERMTYEIMRPEDIGMEGTELVLGKHSGRHAFSHQLAKLGIQLTAEELDQAYIRFKDLADKKKHIYDDDLLMLAREDATGSASDLYVLEHLQVATGSGTIPTATVRLRKGKQVTRQEAASGDGPVDATFKAIDRITGVQGKLTDFSIQAVTVGKDAMGEASLRVAFGDSTISAKAASTDIIEASARAYLSCVNRVLSMKAPAKAKA